MHAYLPYHSPHLGMLYAVSLSSPPPLSSSTRADGLIQLDYIQDGAPSTLCMYVRMHVIYIIVRMYVRMYVCQQ
jgi:hypothetical protein